MPLTAEIVRELLNYDPETGVFTWRIQRKRWRPGTIAGSPHRDGYVIIGTGGRMYQGASAGMALYDRRVAAQRH